jgi:aminoglycoside 2''-phosphotransferase
MNPDLCRAVISKSFPEITIERIQSLHEALDDSSEGWDTYAYLVNGRFVFLFPRPEHGADSLKLLAKLLPQLRQHLSIPIPKFEFVSRGCGQFKQLSVGYRMIEVLPLTEKLFRDMSTKSVAKNLASQLAGFLSELHSFPIERDRELKVPSVPGREVWEQFWSDIKQKPSTPLDRSEQRCTTEVFDSFLSPEKNFQFQPVLLRGDLSPEHILLDREKNGRKKDQRNHRCRRSRLRFSL